MKADEKRAMKISKSMQMRADGKQIEMGAGEDDEKKKWMASGKGNSSGGNLMRRNG